MLTDAKRRGFTIMIFQAQSGAPPDTVRATRPLLTPIPQPPASCPSTGHLTFLGAACDEQDGPDVHNLFNKKSLMASAARIVDTMQQYPMVDGYIWDGPEWGYEIAARHQNHRSCKPLHALVVSCAGVGVAALA